MATKVVTFPDMGIPASEWDWGKTWVIEIPVKVGDRVKADDPILTVECDKATMDVPAPTGGTVREVSIKIGDTVSDATAILTLETDENRPEDKSGAVETQNVTMHPALPSTTTSKVFLVHGHHEAYREMTARFMEKLGLEVVILHEQANEGATIIEK